MNNNNHIYKFVSTDCGSGKTFQTIKQINNSNDKYILVQNTIKLLDKTFQAIPDSRLIISTGLTGNVQAEVVQFLLCPTHRVLLITDKTFFKLNPNLLLGWRIILDDVVCFHSYKNINESNIKIKDVLYSDVFCDFEDLGGIENYVTAKRVVNVGGDLVASIANAFEVVIDNDLFVMNGNYFTDSEKEQLNVLAWKNLEKYSECDLTFMAADFTNTLIYKAHQHFFEEVTLPNLRIRSVPIDERLKVYYFSKNHKFSDNWRKNNQDKIEKISQYLNCTLSGKQYFWTKNEKSKSAAILKLDADKFITCESRGLDKYDTINICVFLAGLFPSDTEAKQLELFFGITGDEVTQARHYQCLYQFVQRGVIRQYASSTQQVVYVFSEAEAKSLSSNIHYIDLSVDEKIQDTTILSDAEKKQFNRWYKKTEQDLNTFNAWVKLKLFNAEQIEYLLYEFERKKRKEGG
ncbi:hypothetical protein BZ20_1388 [Yersinia pseudotuberculosis]|uniref:hypothetical protein n=1 Tax=Yersinia pseudotuberculosis TaxID=633 RepID=UPI0005AD376D|nr:hypothetical protein [Yersinia pseudotuberculosis]AJJ05141.1 hypothetical protein BZ20_1388 [Yersinia pseudotuberculosis]